MTSQRTEFGFHPDPLSFRAGPVLVESLPELASIVAEMATSGSVEKGWIYAPLQAVYQLGGTTRTLPYSSRVFGLPKTHIIEHASSDGDDHLTFHLWALSFLTGMRLTATEAGFLDATPLNSHKLVDFIPSQDSLSHAVALAERFWVDNRSDPQRSRLFAAAVHALFLGQNPRLLQFETFMLFYAAFDACFALAKALSPPPKDPTHAKRVEWMCAQFDMQVPAWAEPATSRTPEVAALRNATFHEALFMGQPLGFALHGGGTNTNLMLEMQALICRFLVALLGATETSYVRSPVNTRQVYRLNLT